jgi:hypothetical protein
MIRITFNNFKLITRLVAFGGFFVVCVIISIIIIVVCTAIKRKNRSKQRIVPNRNMMPVNAPNKPGPPATKITPNVNEMPTISKNTPPPAYPTNKVPQTTTTNIKNFDDETPMPTIPASIL